MRRTLPFSLPHIAHSLVVDPSQLPRREAKRYLSTIEPPRSAAPRSQKDHPSDGVLRLMPLGGSVTYGVGSSHGTGYRKLLLQMLKNQGLNPRMVGSRKDGTMTNNEHEGWRGFKIDEIERKAKKSVGGLSPDVFMLNAGSNDCLQAFEIAEAGKRMGEMIDFLWKTCPQSTVLLSTLIGNADKQIALAVRDVNLQFRALAEKKAAEHKRIVLVDMCSSEGPDVQGLVDGVHPNDEGYDKMAKLWFQGIQEAIHKSFIDGVEYKF